LLSARKQLDVITAYREVGTYRGAAEMCWLTHKTVERVLERDLAVAQRVERRRNYESVRSLVAAKVEDTQGQDQRPAAAASGQGRRLCRFGPQLSAAGRPGAGHLPGGGRRSAGLARPTEWSPGEHLVPGP